MNLKAERQAHEAAGSLAEELPWWGWLPHLPFCLTRSGELVAVARLEPAVLDGRTPGQLDKVLGRWQRMLSQLSPDTRFHFYLLRRPGALDAIEGLDGVADLSQRRRREFLERRLQRVEAYVAWCHNPRMAQAARAGANGGRWWLDAPRAWLRRRRNPHAPGARSAGRSRSPSSRPSVGTCCWTASPSSSTPFSPLPCRPGPTCSTSWPGSTPS